MSRICLILSILACLYVTVVPSAAAQAVDPVSVDRTALTINAVKDHSTTTATFYITPNVGLDSISFFASDLQDTTRASTTQPVIISSQVSFAPATFQSPPVGRRQQVQVSLNDITRAGVWAGQVTIQWTGTVTGELTIPLTVTMRTTPVLAVEAPKQIVVRGMRGAQVAGRGVTLRETAGGSAAANVSIYPQNLYNADQSETLSSTAILARMAAPSGGPSLTQIDGGSRADVVVGLDLSNVPSGNYQGNLIVQSDNADDLLIPIQVDVKDWWLGPLFILLAGVVLGVLLTWYRSSIMPKDQVRVRIQDLREHQEDDAQFKALCGPQKADPAILLAEEHLRRDRPADAGTALIPAETLWFNWVQYRERLILSAQAIEILLAELQKADDGFIQLPGIVKLRDALSTTLEQTFPEYVENPLKLSDKILDADTGWKPVLERALELYADLGELRTTLHKADSGTGHEIDAGDLETLKTQLSGLDEQLRKIADVPIVSALLAIRRNVGILREAIEKAGGEGTAAKSTYNTYSRQAGSTLQQIKSPGPLIAQTILSVRNVLSKAQSQNDTRLWKVAAQLAQNTHNAARACYFLNLSAQEYRKGRSDPPWGAVEQAEKALSEWLRTEANYDQSPDLFFRELSKLAGDLKIAVEQADGGREFPLDWGKAPAGAARGLEASVDATLPALAERPVPVPAIPQGQAAPPPNRGFLSAAWWTPQRRLLVANVTTFVIGVGLLVLIGFKELYIDVHTFGVAGVWDYFKLFMWGFGAEAARAQVLGLVKDWGILTPKPA